MPAQDPQKQESPALATELQLLIGAVTGILDEDLKAGERGESGLRAELAVTGTIFAVVQAAVIGLINGVLAAKEGVESSPFVPWLAGLGAAATAVTAFAVIATFQATRSQGERSLIPDFLRESWQEASDPYDARLRLLAAYSTLAEARRLVALRQAPVYQRARRAMFVAISLLVVELAIAFIAASLRA